MESVTATPEVKPAPIETKLSGNLKVETPAKEVKPEVKPEQAKPEVKPSAEPKPEVKPKSTKKDEYIDEDKLATRLAEKKAKEDEGAPVIEGEPKPATQAKENDFLKRIKEKGFEFSDEDDLIDKLDKLKNTKSTKVDTAKIKTLNTTVRNIEKLVNLSDEKLLEQKFILDGMAPEKAAAKVARIVDKDGIEEVGDQADTFRTQANKYLTETQVELDKALETGVDDGENVNEYFNTLDKGEEIFGVSRETFAEEIDALKKGNYKSILEVLPKDQLARAILFGRNEKKFIEEIGNKYYEKGFDKGWEQVKKKVLNHEPSQGGGQGRQAPRTDGKKPDNDRVLQKFGLK